MLCHTHVSKNSAICKSLYRALTLVGLKGNSNILVNLLNVKTNTMNSTHMGKCILLLLVLSTSHLFADPGFEQRRTQYAQELGDTSSRRITLQAFNGVTLSPVELNKMFNDLVVRSTQDFVIVEMVRALYLHPDTAYYNSLIVPELLSVPYWVTKGDTLRGYWSENHMIQWMSSDWLLHERYGKQIDSDLDARLRHYLRLKNNFGFYEFFSSTYATYTLSGLLNLADFAQDAEIKQLATTAAQRLLKDILLMANDQGRFYPAAGRNYWGRYDDEFNSSTESVVYLLTGMGRKPTNSTHGASFLATTSIDVDGVIASWQPVINTTKRVGHSIDSLFILNGHLAERDQIMFQWSSGSYFDPLVAERTANFINDSLLWNHVDLSDFSSFSDIPPANAAGLAEFFSAVSKSSSIVGQTLNIYKSNSVALHSVQDFWKGKAGFQQFPCVATVGKTAVLTGAGTIAVPWGNRGSTSNEHLPYVGQDGNVALVMYRPEDNNILLESKDVALHFRDGDFDEVIDNDPWLFGRLENSYVAVRKACNGMIGGVRACETTDGQTWVIVVGDTATHTDFANFQSVVGQAVFQENWYNEQGTGNQVYYASINVDGKTVEYAWGATVTSIEETTTLDSDLLIYPNPASASVTVRLPVAEAAASISIIALDGREVFTSDHVGIAQAKLNTSNIPAGMYTLVVEQNDKRYFQKLVLTGK